MSKNRWIMLEHRRPRAAVRLFCFPYAGAGASAFRDWQVQLPEQIEVVGVQLPGRENRFSEPRFDRLADMLGPLREAVAGLADKPFYFFGHSMGALIAFELARALQRSGARAPFHLVVSGMRAPQSPLREEPYHLMDDDTLLRKISDFNGTPKALLENPDLMRFFLPQLRDDFAVFETYRYASDAPVRCPLTALGGDADPNVSLADVEAWAEVAGNGFERFVFEGDHFFLQPKARDVLDLLAAIGADGAARTTAVGAAAV